MSVNSVVPKIDGNQLYGEIVNYVMSVVSGYFTIGILNWIVRALDLTYNIFSWECQNVQNVNEMSERRKDRQTDR